MNLAIFIQLSARLRVIAKFTGLCPAINYREANLNYEMLKHIYKKISNTIHVNYLQVATVLRNPL